MRRPSRRFLQNHFNTNSNLFVNKSSLFLPTIMIPLKRILARSQTLSTMKSMPSSTSTAAAVVPTTGHTLISQAAPPPTFGFLFDIDGVFLRGRSVLPSAREALQYLVNDNGKWRVPVVFVTNAGNTLKQTKAESLSEKLHIEVSADQVVMAHTPLSVLTQFHDKHVLVCGQGPVRQIARNLGFTKISSVEDVAAAYPQLDVCDHNRRRPAPCAFEKHNKTIEAIVLLGEPLKWETSLQILMDILLTNGQPYANEASNSSSSQHNENANYASSHHSYPHIPVLACNMDLTWMAEAPLPRLAHGSFLVCLETLYSKISGHRLLYTSLVGKPSESTFHHAEYRLQQMAFRLRLAQTGVEQAQLQQPVKRIYCVGDNLHTDIYGANLYQRYLQLRRSARHKQNYNSRQAYAAEDDLFKAQAAQPMLEWEGHPSKSNHNNSAALAVKEQWRAGLAEEIASILVCTGIYQNNLNADASIESVIEHLKSNSSVNHHHRDFQDLFELKIPNYVAENVGQAVRDVLLREKFPLH